MERLAQTNAEIKQSSPFVPGKKKSLSFSKHQTKSPVCRVQARNPIEKQLREDDVALGDF